MNNGKLHGQIRLNIPGKDTSLEGSFAADVKNAVKEIIQSPTDGVADNTTPLIKQFRAAFEKNRQGDIEDAITIYKNINVELCSTIRSKQSNRNNLRWALLRIFYL